ncbi:acid protease [Thozetella sp. PMI_491]|nr:acid protease [Thozetella sp. PMI_491]
MTFLYHTSYVIPVKIGGQDFQLSVDTGSSDTWVIKNNFTCIDTFFGVVEPAYCNFGPTFNGTFKYGLVPNVANFSFQYADGSYVSGQTGYEDVTLAGVTIKKQQMLMTSEAAWAGDRITSGILGLSYPLETRIFNGTASDQNFLGSSTHRKYDPVFTNMYKQGLVDPVFSMAMDRAAQKGWLAFGGLPPVEVENLAATSVENTYYTIIPDGFTFGRLNTTNFNYSNPTWNGLFNDTNKSQFPVMIDSGATLSYLPRDIVLPYVRQFTGPVGRFGGQYWAPCNATIPAFGITIGGKTFYLNNSDLLQQEVQQEQLYNDTPITLCLIGMMDTFPNGPFVFGDTFLNSLVTVFDVGKSEMRFYKRK